MKELKDTLWKAADKLRGSLSASQYKDVILGLVFLKYVSDAYDELKLVEERMYTASSAEQLHYLAERINLLDNELGDVWVSSDETNRFYTMKSAIALVRREIQERLQKNPPAR